MVRIKIISAGERDDPHASCDASRSPPDAPASPRAEPLDSPGAFPTLGSGSGPPSPTTPPSPRRYPAPRAPRSSDDSSRGTSGGSSGGSSWSSGSGSDVPAAPPAVRAASECLALVRALSAELEAAKKKADAASRAADAASRDARRERARRESADARFDALSRLYVAKFKEDTSVIDTDARVVSCPARSRVPGPGPARGGETRETRDGGDDFSRAEKPLPRVGATRTFASAVVYDDIDALFREARELVLGENGGKARDEEDTRSETKRCPADDATRDATENVVLKNDRPALKPAAALKTSLDAETKTTPKTTPKTPCVFTTAYARLGSRSDTVTTGDPANARPDDSDLLPGWSFTGVTKDTKFRKRCPMHEGPCADCGARCRVPFRPTRGAARGRDDPLCARCLAARKEHRKAATERDWKERREEARA